MHFLYGITSGASGNVADTQDLDCGMGQNQRCQVEVSALLESLQWWKNELCTWPLYVKNAGPERQVAMTTASSSGTRAITGVIGKV